MAGNGVQPAARRVITLREDDLKICELCGQLNLATNRECFVCRWRGHFETDAGLVHAAVSLTVKQYGRLELQHLTDPVTYSVSHVTLGDRLVLLLRRTWRALIG
ncbi:MAG: hypothetical protein KGJ62_08110 [Armatimonadetes bacterium]|nr:hypothetical protein [Armatimonadota bacterium]MDE2205240.1 hypothetical protein [Armatimonadota bacterium]